MDIRPGVSKWRKNMELRLSEDSMLRINLTQDIGNKKCLEMYGRR
jgi:hypothetical protein